MPSRTVLRVALLRGLLLAAAFAVMWPVANLVMYGSTSWWQSALFGAFWGAVAAPCAALEAIGRRRRARGVVLAALTAWALAAVLELWYGPAVAFATTGGGLDGLHAAGDRLSRGQLGWKVAHAVAMGSLYGALTLVRAAGAGALAQVVFTCAATTAALAVNDWLHPITQLFWTFHASYARGCWLGVPPAIAAVAGACLADRIAWRSADVPSPVRQGGVAWALVALALVVGPLALLQRQPATQRRVRIELAKGLLPRGGPQRELAIMALLDEAPEEGRRALVDLGVTGDPLLVDWAYSFFDHVRELQPLLDAELPAARVVALRALRRLADPYTVEDTSRSLWDPDPAVAEAAAAALLDPQLEDYRVRAGDRERYLGAVRRSLVVHVQARELLSHPDPARRASALELIDVTDDAPDVDEMRRTRAALARRVELETDPALRERALTVQRHGGAWGRGW